jgi:hypothetical protein
MIVVKLADKEDMIVGIDIGMLALFSSALFPGFTR